METLVEEKDIKALNDKRLTEEVGVYHTNEAVKLYNEAIMLYQNSDIREIGEDKLISLLKRAIPHLVECKKFNHKDDRLSEIISGIQSILTNGNLSELAPIRL